MLLGDTIKLVKVHMLPFCDKFKHVKKKSKVKTFLNFFGTYKEVRQVADISTTEVKLYTDKCHLLLNSQEPNTLKLGDLYKNNSLSEKLLGITFDCTLNLTNTSKVFAKKQEVTQKLNTLARLAPYMGTNKKHILMNAIFKSEVNYCQ